MDISIMDINIAGKKHSGLMDILFIVLEKQVMKLYRIT